MNENLFEAQYDVTKKSRIKKFYESNKTIIFSFIIFFLIFIGTTGYYFDSKERKRVALSENYIEAKIHLENGEKDKAINILKKVIYSNDTTYSTLSLFLILNQNLIKDYNELKILFNHTLENNKFEKELKNLLIFKKALFDSNFVNESELLESVKPIINEDTLWKPHALLLLGDYFFSQKEYFKAKEFYLQILTMKNLHKDLYEKARLQLSLILNG